jgi:hypothetical protein
LLNRVYELVTEEKPGLPLFRNCDLKATVEAILKYTSSKVGVAQVYNHPRHWRSRWVHVCMLKKMEGVRWVEKTSSIMMDDDAYYAYTKVNALQILLHFIH